MSTNHLTHTPLAPIVLFAYNRPWHVAQTINALKANPEAAESDIYLFADAPRNPDQESNVEEVRRFLHSVTGFRSASVIERPHNLGLANSIIDGVTATLEKHGSVIVLEDDMITSPHFLQYMNEALALYGEDEDVASVHAYLYPTDTNLPESFFLRGTDCWGWATWRDAWQTFNPNGQQLLDELNTRDLIYSFNYDNTYSYSGMLQDQINGKNDSWAVRWHASAYLAGKLTLFPGRSLIQNIGNDNSGTHCDDSDVLDVDVSTTPVELKRIPVEESDIGRRAVVQFFDNMRGSLLKRALRKVGRTLRFG